MGKLKQEAKGIKQEFDSGMTLNEMWEKQAEMMETLDRDKTFPNLLNTVKIYLKEQGNPEFVMLNSRKNNYMTIFQDINDDIDIFANLITDFLLEDTKLLGGLKMYSTEDNVGMIQMYIGTTHYALFNCNSLMVTE